MEVSFRGNSSCYNKFADNKTVQNSNNETKSINVQSKQESSNEKKKNYIKIGIIVAASVTALIAGYKGISAIVKKATIPKELPKAPEIPLIEKFPELRPNAEEYTELRARTDEKYDKGILDIDYWKDLFRAEVILPAEDLKIAKKSNNPELSAAVGKKWLDDGIMVYGSDRPEKKELFQHFIDEAKKAEFDIIRIPSNGFKVLQTPYGKFKPQNAKSHYTGIAQAIHYLYPKAKEKYSTEKKMTMFVIEDADDLLSHELCGINDEFRGQWNENTHQSGRDGVITITTAKDLAPLDMSCTRGGRITHKINIDDAVKLSQNSSEN